MKKRREEQRKTLLINPVFQKHFLAFSMGIGLAVTGVFYLALSYFFWKFKNKGISLGLPPDHTFFHFLDEQRFTMNLIFLVASGVIMLLVASYGLYMSNRIAGPIYRVQSHLKAWLAGRVKGGVTFRKEDYFLDLADSVNQVLKSKESAQKPRKKAS